MKQNIAQKSSIYFMGHFLADVHSCTPMAVGYPVGGNLEYLPVNGYPRQVSMPGLTPMVLREMWLLTWWRHQMETFSALLAICAGNSPVPGEFPTQRPVTRSFDVLTDLRLNKQFNKQSWGWWLETLSRPLWRHRNDPFPNVNGGFVKPQNSLSGMNA